MVVLLSILLVSPASAAFAPALRDALATAFAPKSLPAAAELRDALIAGERSSSVITPLVDECAAARVPFRGELLGDGTLWRACSVVRGEIPRWERNAKLLPFLSNRAGQAYTLDARTGGGSVVNYGEVLGRGLYFRAEGTFAPARTSNGGNRCPQDFDVAIREGGFVLGGQAFTSSAISGPGFLRCLYLDADVRIFESPKDSPDRWEEAGLVVVQVRDALFPDPVDGEL